MNKHIQIFCEGKDEVQFILDLVSFVKNAPDYIIQTNKIIPRFLKSSFNKTNCNNVINKLEEETQKSLSKQIELKKKNLNISKMERLHFIVVDKDKWRCKHAMNSETHNKIILSDICFDNLWYDLIGKAPPKGLDCDDMKIELQKYFNKNLNIDYDKNNYLSLLKKLNITIEDLKKSKSNLIKLILKYLL